MPDVPPRPEPFTLHTAPGALEDAGVSDQAAAAAVEENAQARLDGLRSALAVLALIALVGLFFTGRIPAEQPGAEKKTVVAAA